MVYIHQLSLLVGFDAINQFLILEKSAKHDRIVVDQIADQRIISLYR